MNYLKNLSIRNKLLFGFILILFVLASFIFYLVIRLEQIDISLHALDSQAQKLQLFLKLDADNKQLVDAIKSYVLTRNNKWEKTYDTTASDLSATLQQLKSVAEQDEISNLTKLEANLDATQGTELLILAKVKEGDIKKATSLFDTVYEKRQGESTTLIASLVKGENNDFFSTLAQDNDALTNTRNLIFGVSALLLLVTIAIAFLINSLIGKSLKELVQSVKKIAEGNLGIKVPITSHDELGELAAAFNNMADALQVSHQNIEQKIAEKTTQLSEKVTSLDDTKKAMVNVMEDLQKEKELIGQEKAKDDAIIKSIGDGMIVVDATGKILVINPVAQQLLGVEEKNSIGKFGSEVYTLFDETGTIVPTEKRPIMVTLKTGLKISQTYTYIKKDKTKISINIIATPIQQNTTIIGAIGIFRDITKEKEVDRMKTEFISLASHQLRTPLSAIKWFSEMLAEGDAGELNNEQKEFAQNVVESTERMIQLVNSLLNISRIESGRILVDPKPTDLKELVQGVVTDLKAKIVERQQNLLISVHEDLPKINLDPRLIRQVYMNLLTNAIKYTPKGGEITVFISKKDEQIISQVSDNGYGIPKAQQDKIFQKFFRAENIIKVETDGTGLGLYLIKAIIESSKGKIWFESEEGKGTSFWFSLPLSGMEAKKGEVTLDE